MTFRALPSHYWIRPPAASQPRRDYPESVYIRRQLANDFIIRGVYELFRAGRLNNPSPKSVGQRAVCAGVRQGR